MAPKSVGLATAIGLVGLVSSAPASATENDDDDDDDDDDDNDDEDAVHAAGFDVQCAKKSVEQQLPS